MIHVNTALVNASDSYTLSLASQLTVGEIARYFSRHEAFVSASTLEVALPIRTNQRLQDVDLRGGDRLVLFPQPARPHELPQRLKPGDKVLRFRRGDFEITSSGKKGLLLGKADENLEALPDIDLRYFVDPNLLEFVSKGCLWLSYEEAARRWYISRPGQTRVMLDEFELGSERIPLDGTRRLRFYPPAETRDFPLDRLLGEMQIQVDEVRPVEQQDTLPVGSQRVRLNFGTEQEMVLLRASGNVALGQIVTNLSSHYGTPLTNQTRLYQMRLVPPETTVQELGLGADTFLYTARNMYYAQHLLLLRDVAQRTRVFAVPSGGGDDEKLIGCRQQPQIPDTTLDVDLYEAFARYSAAGRTLARYLGRIVYKQADHAWWFWLDEQAQFPVYVNNTRAVQHSGLRLASGDVLSFGYTPTDYLRFEVEITTRK